MAAQCGVSWVVPLAWRCCEGTRYGGLGSGEGLEPLPQTLSPSAITVTVLVIALFSPVFIQPCDYPLLSRRF